MVQRLLMYPGAGYVNSPAVPWQFEGPSGAVSFTGATQTQGLQEGLDYAKVNRLNFTCEGGQDNVGPQIAVLCIAATVQMGPNRNFHGVFNGVTMSGTIQLRAPTLHIQSQMMSCIEFNGGSIAGYTDNAPVVLLRPDTPNVPNDPVQGIGSSRIRLPALIAGFNPFTPNAAPIVLQLTAIGNGGISDLELEWGEINGEGISGAQGLVVNDPAPGCTFSINRLRGAIHECPGGAAKIGFTAHSNIFGNSYELAGSSGPGETFCGTFTTGDNYNFLIDGGGQPGTTACVEMVGPNNFSGTIKSYATAFAYPRAGSRYNCLIV